MKALIFNSGLGKRMGALTDNCHKSMVKLQDGQSIYERQIDILSKCGITEYVVTVGCFKEQLIEISKNSKYSNLHFEFVDNPDYAKTNYIYSMYLASSYIDDDIIMLHGDLVFNKGAVDYLLSSDGSVAFYNPKLPLPEKDFKARIKDNRLLEVGVKIFDDDCYAFQPLYKLSKEVINAWVESVDQYINENNKGVYAENALNEILSEVVINTISYEDHYIAEVDDENDLMIVSEAIKKFDY